MILHLNSSRVSTVSSLLRGQRSFDNYCRPAGSNPLLFCLVLQNEEVIALSVTIYIFFRGSAQLEELDVINARFKQRLAGGFLNAEQKTEASPTVPVLGSSSKPNSSHTSPVSVHSTPSGVITSQAQSQSHSPLPFTRDPSPSRLPSPSPIKTNQRWCKGARSRGTEVICPVFGPEQSYPIFQSSNSAVADDSLQRSGKSQSNGHYIMEYLF